MESGEIAIIFSLSAVTIFFTVYHFFVHSAWVVELPPVKRIVRQRISGFFLMGFIPLILALLILKADLSYFGWGLQNLGKTLLWVLGAIVVILPLSFFAARSPANLEVYPQIRVSEWTFSLLFKSNLTWVLYLVGYETLFRGILFFPLLDHLGLITALAINVAIYSIAHIPKGLQETIGAIPFGIVVCLAAGATGTLWFPLLAHCAMALSSEWFSLYHHPEMQLKKAI